MHSPVARAASRASAVLAFGLVALAALLSCYPFVAPGHPYSVDAWPHLARQSVVYHAIREGFAPFYTFMFYCGFPVLRFYSPLFHFLGGILTLFTAGNLVLALRILLVLLQLASAWTMYALLLKRERGEGARFGPALGTIAYLAIPWRTLYLAGVSNYPHALVYVLLPLAFLALENLFDGERAVKDGLRQGLLLGLWVGLLFLAHLVYAIFALLFLAVWWLARNPTRARGHWRALGLAALACLGVSAFFLVPFAAEQASHRFPLAFTSLSVPDWMVLLGLKRRTSGYSGDYLGLSVILLVLAATVATLFRRRYRTQVPALLGLAIALLLTFVPSLLGDRQYLVTGGLPAERFLVFAAFFMAILVPPAYELAQNALSRSRLRTGVVFAVIATLMLIDCLRAVFQIYFVDRRQFLAVREEIYPIVSGEPHARLLDLNIPEPKVDDPRRTGRLPTVGVIYGGLPTPLGLPYHQYAPRSMLYVYPWVDYIADDIGVPNGRQLSSNTHKALALMGSSHIITLPSLISTGGTPEGPFAMLLKKEMDWDDRFVAARREPPFAFGRTHQGLILAANRVVPMAPDRLAPDQSFIVAANWRSLLDTLQFDATRHSLNFIPARAGTQPESLPGAPAVVIESTRIRHQDIVTGFQADAGCFLRIAVSYYPELEVLLDGKPVAYFETADHFTYIRCPAGPHVLSVRARLGGLRIATLLLSLVSFPLVIAMILRLRPKLEHQPGKVR